MRRVIWNDLIFEDKAVKISLSPEEPVLVFVFPQTHSVKRENLIFTTLFLKRREFWFYAQKYPSEKQRTVWNRGRQGVKWKRVLLFILEYPRFSNKQVPEPITHMVAPSSSRGRGGWRPRSSWKLLFGQKEPESAAPERRRIMNLSSFTNTKKKKDQVLQSHLLLTSELK